MVYDITNEDTFAKAKHWVSELQKNAGNNIGAKTLLDFGCASYCRHSTAMCKPTDGCSQIRAITVVVLVGNKTDLAEDRVITEEEGQEYATR